MNGFVPDRSEAYQLLLEYNQTEGLIKHALTVEAVMRHFARIFNEDVEVWGLIGLMHDLDYEKYPQQHCLKVREILSSRNWPENYIRAIQSHGWGICCDFEPQSLVEKVLYTIDELTGLIAATALVRPSRSILDMTVKSVKRKWKDRAFAAGVNRESIENGAKNLELDLDKVIEETIKGMQAVAETIGLKGEAVTS